MDVGLPLDDAARAPARSAGPLAVFYLLSFAALGVSSPYLPLWLDAHGFSGVALSAIVALSPAMSFVGPPLAGAWSDTRGARGNLLTLACGLAALAMLALGVAQGFGLAGRFTIVFAVVLAFAICRSPIIMLADRIALEHGGHYARRRVWGSIGFLIAASAFGRWLSPESGRWLPFVLAGIMAAAALASSRLPRTATSARAPSLRAAAQIPNRRRFVAFLICSALFSASHSSIDLCGSLYFRDLGASGGQLGLLWATGVFAEILLMTLVGRALSVRTEGWLVLAYAGGALRWFLTSRLPAASFAFLTQPLHAISFGLVWLTSLEHVRRTTSLETFGTAQGLFIAANATGSVLGMLSWGPLYTARGGPSVFLGATAVGLLAAFLALMSLYRTPRASAPGARGCSA
jgi:MFS transporter, PPP family, 3-phenylpropionic acid transporter